MTNKRKHTCIDLKKQNEAHHKNEFKKKLLKIAKAVSFNDAYKLLTDKIIDHIYINRIKTLRILPGEGVNFSAKELQDIKDNLLYHLKSQDLEIETADEVISVYDFSTAGFSLWYYLHHLKKSKPDLYPVLLSEFKEFMETEGMVLAPFKILGEQSNIIAWSSSAFDKKYYSIKFEFNLTQLENFFLQGKVQCFDPEIINITMDGVSRPLFRVGLTSNGSGVVWVGLPASALGLNSVPPDTKLPVYIQHHAMSRLKERLDCANHTVIFIDLIDSLDEAKIIYYKGVCLIEFRYFQKKIGYLLVEIVNETVIIRTFLLLTHSGTPEGDSLHQILGFEKPDISFLNLDRLSTFIYSNFNQNQQLSDLFSRAGCSSLLDSEKRVYDNECIVAKASMIESYLSKYQEYINNMRFEELMRENQIGPVETCSA